MFHALVSGIENLERFGARSALRRSSGEAYSEPLEFGPYTFASIRTVLPARPALTRNTTSGSIPALVPARGASHPAWCSPIFDWPLRTARRFFPSGTVDPRVRRIGSTLRTPLAAAHHDRERAVLAFGSPPLTGRREIDPFASRRPRPSEPHRLMELMSTTIEPFCASAPIGPEHRLLHFGTVHIVIVIRRWRLPSARIPSGRPRHDIVIQAGYVVTVTGDRLDKILAMAFP